ncbi:Lrp/AsnC family transcriptional regulator [Niallia sp. Sow4_A1]|uniref:Lrp/AsnC family transcriptional regulator n=1 Tax=Niallia hominis TaxID=3133173 RepID=A0ABV1EXC5_9BACI|nr:MULTISPECIES: Lrp/AsnC family transcriptional regulator [Bacillaceae]MCF2646758.1 Lrp/AsnC family transcriptional regulator [Niallia circulans]CAI9397010.1 Leucine-responsive regulatory protein [Bacillus sp. T2.9-1]
MNSYDLKIIECLMANSRIKWADLAKEVGLSAPATAERVNRLIQQGVIKNFSVLLDSEKVGSELTAFVAVSLEHPKNRGPFLELVNKLEEVQECHHIAGEDDYLLKIRSRNTKDLDRVISHEIKGLKGIIRTKTTIVMDTTKETFRMPLQKHKFLIEEGE